MPRNRRDVEWRREVQRLLALALESVGAWDSAVMFWHGYVTAATSAGALRPNGPALSRILLHMAELFPGVTPFTRSTL